MCIRDRLYVSIDNNLKENESRADNVYRFIERITKSDQPSNKLMSYGLAAGCAQEVKVMRTEVKHCTEQVEKMSEEYSELKRQFEVSRKQLHSAQQALRDVTNEKLMFKKQRDVAERKAEMFQELRSEYALLEEEFAQLQEENVDFSTAISTLESELASLSDATTDTVSEKDTNCLLYTSPSPRDATLSRMPSSA